MRIDADHVDLVFSNAGVGGAGSFIKDSREEWERVFAIDWWGVYYCARAFLPLLIKSAEGVLVNTSSANGFFATLGPGAPHTAYSTAKFAVKGFSEALIEDLRTNAPHVRVAVVMPGHVGTNIVGNSLRAFGLDPEHMTDDELEAFRPRLAERGLPDGMPVAELRRILITVNTDFRDKAPVTAAEAATVILDGVRVGRLAHPHRQGRRAARRVRSRQPGCHLRLRRDAQELPGRRDVGASGGA